MYSETETLLLAAGNGSDNNQYKKFSSSRGYVPPSVSITYNDTTPTTPTGLTTQFTDTLVPRMSGTVHDADGSAMTAYFTVRNAAGTVIGGAGGSQASVANGAVAGFAIPGTQLIPNQPYTWSMHACANGLCSPETAAVPLRINPLRGAGDVRGHHSTSVSSGAGSKVSVDLASGDASAGVTGFTFAGNAGYSLPVGVRYDSLAVAPGAVPASGTGGAGLGWRFASGPGVSLTITADKTVDLITPGGAVHDFCCEPGPNYFRDGNYDADFNKLANGTYKLVEHASQSEYDFAAGGQLTDQFDRNHNGFHFTYAPGAVLTRIDATNPAGTVVRSLTVSTDSSHRITGVSQAGDGTTPARSAGFGYNGGGYLDQVTDPAGQNTTLGYDGAGNLTSLTTSGGRQISVGYDSSHRATAVTQHDPAGTDATTSLAYSDPTPTSTQTKLYDPDHPVSSGVATTYAADNTGKITRVTDPFGQHSDTSYTPSSSPGGDQVAASTSPAAGTTTNTYGANGGESLTKSAAPAGTMTAAYTNTGSANKYLPSQTSDPNGVKTNFTYDAPGNQLTSADGSGGSPAATASVARNNDGTVSASTDPNNKAAGNSTHYGYDSLGQLTSVTPPTGNSLGARHYTHDVFGRQATSTSGNGVTTSYAYDTDGRPTGQSTAGTPVCPSPGSASTVCYSYDSDGNVLTRTDAAGTTTFTYDGQGRQVSKALSGGPDTYRFDYTHDPAGNLTASTETIGATVHTVHYGYNNAELLDQATEGDGTVDLFGYNTDHQRTDTWYAVSGANSTPTYSGANPWQLQAPAGYGGHIALTVAGGKLTAEKTTLASGTTSVASDLSYAYSLASGPCGVVPASPNKDAVTDHQTGNTTYYCRDARGHLTREDTLTSGGGTVSDYAYSYDNDGNRTSGPEGTHGYNSANQLTTSSYDAAGNQTAPGNIGYNQTDQAVTFNGTAASYAGADQKERTTLGATSYAQGATGTASITTPAGTTFYDRDPDGTLLAEHGPDGDLNYVFDGHGSVTALIDHTGTIQATYSYDAYGNHATVAGPNGTAANNNPWRYTSGLLDNPSGLYKFGQRYYQPTLGTWTQQDSIEALANLTQGNRYAYAGDDPVNNIDPTGEFFGEGVLKEVDNAATQVVGDVAGCVAGGAGLTEAAAPFLASSLLYSSAVGATAGAIATFGVGCVIGIATNSYTDPFSAG